MTFGKIALHPLPPPGPPSTRDLARQFREANTSSIPVLGDGAVYEVCRAGDVLWDSVSGNGARPAPRQRAIVVDIGDSVVTSFYNDAVTMDSVFLVSSDGAIVGWTTAAEALMRIVPEILPKVLDLVQRDDYIVLPDAFCVYDVHKELFRKKRRIALALNEDGAVSGALSDKDITSLIERGCDIWNSTLETEAKPVVSVPANTLLKEAYAACLSAKASQLVATDGAGQPVGTITVDEIWRGILSSSLGGASWHGASAPLDETLFLDTVLSDSLRTGIVGADEYLNVAYCNDAIFDFLHDAEALMHGGIRAIPASCGISADAFDDALAKAHTGAEQVLTGRMQVLDTVRYIQCRIRRVDRNEKLVGFVFSVQDITSQRNAEDAIRELAYQDKLTRLPNRLLFEERLEQEVKRSKRSGRKFAMLMMDLDGFKQINDRYGHTVGDELLQIIGRRLLDSVRESDTVARYGGDEFVFLLPDIAEAGDVEKLIGKIKAIIREPCRIEGDRLEINGSIGFAIYPDDATSTKGLINRADSNMYSEKRGGPCRFPTI